MKDELKPCPFCGGEAAILRTKSKIWVQCERGHTNKDAEFKLPSILTSVTSAEDRDNHIIKKWNNRPIEEALKADNEMLRIALKKISTFSIGQGSSVRNYTEGYLDIKDIAIQALEGK